MTEISLDRIFVASAQRRVALTSETAGYLVLGVADALAGEGGKVTVGDLRLDSEGRVLVGHVTPCSRASTDEFLRSLLKVALDVAVCLRPALVRLAEQLSCRTESRTREFARELETALIPVNRAAARRALARLHRDVTRLQGAPDKPEHGLREPQSRHLRSGPTEALPGENRQQASAPPQEGAAVQGKRTIYEMLSKRAAHLPSDVMREGRFAPASASIQAASDALARAASEGRAEPGLSARTPESVEGNATDMELHRPERTLALPNVKRRSASPAQVMIGSVSNPTLPASTGVERCLLHDPEGPTPELPRAASSVEQTAALPILPMPAIPSAASKSGTDASLGATLERTLALPLRARQREDVDPLTDRCGSRSLAVASQLPTAPDLAIFDSLERTMAVPIVTKTRRFSVEEPGERAVKLPVEDAEQRPVFVEPIECTNLLPWLTRTAEPVAGDASINVVASESAASINVVASESAASINVVASESAASINVVASESAASINVVASESAASINVVAPESAASINVVASEKTKAALASAVAHRSLAMLESIEPTMRLPLCAAPREPLIATFEAHPSEAIETLPQAKLETAEPDGSTDYITYDASGRSMVTPEFDAAQSMMGAGYAQITLEKRAEAYGSPAIGLADAPNECDPLEVTMALPLVRRRLGPSLRMVRSGPSDWERTSVDAVVEIEDHEIYYVEPSMELHVDEGGDFETESVKGEPTVSGLPRSDTNEVRIATEHRVTPSGLEPQGLGPVEPGPRSDELADVEEDEAATGVPTTHYGSRAGILLPTYSSIETLSDQFVTETLWSEAELSRRLCLAAGVETAEVFSRTPPPIATPSFASQSAAQLEPTRRLRRVGPALSAGAAVVVALCLYGNARHGASALVASSPHSDALAQICRGTVNVRGVEPEHRLQIRQTGEEHFREPTRIVGTTATFLGLTCGRDAELLIDDDRDGLRRIPIPGMRLQPLDAHSWAVTDLRLDGAT